MTFFDRLLVIAFILTSLSSHAQQNFKKELREANPVKQNSTLSIENIKKVHEDYLTIAIREKNETHQFYGILYLFLDHYKIHSYIEASKYLLQAENLANTKENPSWNAAILLRKALLADNINNDSKEALKHYQMALKFCTDAKDSLCMGETLEQISSMLKQLDEYEKAEEYYTLALPILEKYADRQQMALTYNNYSTLLSRQKKLTESIQYIDSAISLARFNNDPYKEMMYLNNKGSHLSDMGQNDLAIDIYKKCVPINKQHDWLDRLVQNYLGISEAYKQKGKYDSAYTYLYDFFWLKDSIAGVDVKMKIAELESTNKSQQKDLGLKNKQIELDEARIRVSKWTWATIVGMFSLIAIAGIWYFQNKRVKLEKVKDKKSLDDLTRLLLKKNSLLTELEEKLSKNIEVKTNTETDDFELNLYNQRILTDEDWASFKIYFENVYPGFIKKLRTAHSDLTEAEERLFLFIKLNLTNKEAAAILGISAETVKKTRTRLRKRLNLPEEINLDEYVKEF